MNLFIFKSLLLFSSGAFHILVQVNAGRWLLLRATIGFEVRANPSKLKIYL